MTRSPSPGNVKGSTTARTAPPVVDLAELYHPRANTLMARCVGTIMVCSGVLAAAFAGLAWTTVP